MSQRKRFLVPEVVQSSGMDCGPAALKAFVEGHGVSVSYGRLREACQTDVDGTAIETLEEIANELGVAVEQVMLPKDLVLLEEAEALPCIAVMRLPNGNTHFAVIWSVVTGIVQVMDPATGRRWMTRGQLVHELYEHNLPVPAGDWREWASSEQGLGLLTRRLSALNVSKGTVDELIRNALSDSSWRSLAALDAAVRAVRSMLDAGACRGGDEAASLVATLFKDADSIPRSYWSTKALPDAPGPDTDNDVVDEIMIRGAAECVMLGS